MPRYKVESGGLRCVIETKYDAEPRPIAIMAIERNPKVKALGLIMEIKGGEYIKDKVAYVSTESILQGMGAIR